MGYISFPDSGRSRRKTGASALALCWISGLILGMLVYRSAGSSLASLMRSTPQDAVSIAGLLCLTFFPFLISAFAVSLSRSALFLVCFGKAFLFAFAALGVSQAFGCAGWLLLRLILFSDCMLLPLLYFLWLRLLAGNSCGWENACIWALALLIVSIDYRIISPILASLIEI